MIGKPTLDEEGRMDENRKQARLAGVLYALVAVTAPIGLMYVPGQLLDVADATVTASRIASHASLLRLGIASELFHQTIEVFLVLVLFNLFKPVHLSLARHMAILGWMPIPIVFLNALNEVAALMLVSGAGFLSVFDKPQLDAAVLFFMRLHGYGLQLAAVFWGLWLFPFGILVLRCGFIPKVLGWLVMAAGLGYLIGSFTSLIAPQFAQSLSNWVFLLEMGEPFMILWLLVFGARRSK